MCHVNMILKNQSQDSQYYSNDNHMWVIQLSDVKILAFFKALIVIKVIKVDEER